MLAPSGDQHGPNVLTGSFVTIRTFPPFASATNTSSPWPGLMLVNATLLPSGDQAGEVAPVVVNLVTAPPSAFIEYISRLPSRLLVKKILPSGDQSGLESTLASTVNRDSLLPSVFTTKISRFPSSARTNARRWPSRDHAGSLSSAFALVTCASALPSAFIT